VKVAVSRLFADDGSGHLKKLEAAIGIEPVNKGFAVRTGSLSLNVIECHRRVNIGVSDP